MRTRTRFEAGASGAPGGCLATEEACETRPGRLLSAFGTRPPSAMLLVGVHKSPGVRGSSASQDAQASSQASPSSRLEGSRVSRPARPHALRSKAISVAPILSRYGREAPLAPQPQLLPTLQADADPQFRPNTHQTATAPPSTRTTTGTTTIKPSKRGGAPFLLHPNLKTGYPRPWPLLS